GLSVGILGDTGQAMRLADQLDSGKIHINEQTVSDEPNVPFGGVKDSGNGSRFGGAAANIESFTETQWLTMRSAIAEYPFCPLFPGVAMDNTRTLSWQAILCWLTVLLEGYDMVALGASSLALRHSDTLHITDSRLTVISTITLV